MAQVAKGYMPTLAVIADLMLGLIVWCFASIGWAIVAMVCVPIVIFIAIITTTQPTSGEG